jgi:sensor histidine kinase YesM
MKYWYIFLLISYVSFAQKEADYLRVRLKVIAEKKVFTYHKDSTILLSSDQNSILFKIESNDSPKSYIYQLKGLDTTWHTLENTDNLIVSNLLGGDYVFTIKSKSKAALSKSIKFEVEPLIWQNSWFLPLFYLFSAVIVGMITYLLSLYRLRKELQLQAVKHEVEIKALRAQMNPHFIFNSMNTIDAYILRKRFIEASDFLQKFSKLIRRILENSENQTISITQELETLQLYIELEQERFSHSFSYEFNIESLLTQSNYQIPPLLIQPFIENAILHGIRHLTDRKGHILLHLTTQTDFLLCKIEDNGIGRNASSEINKQRQASHKSMGMNITMERISTYQAIYGDKMETKIIDLEAGTRVEIKLPLIVEK